MQEPQRMLKHRNHARPRDVPLNRNLISCHSRFRKFDVPIAEVIPEKVIQRLHDAVKFVSLELFVHFACRFIQTRQNPTVVQRKTIMIPERIID